MGKCIKTTILSVVMAVILSISCFAAENDGELIDEFLSGAPQNFTVSSDGDYLNLTEKTDYGNILNSIVDLISSQLKNGTYLFVSVCVIVLLFSVLKSFESATVKSLEGILGTVISISVLAICFETIRCNINIISDSVESMKVFSTAAIPVIATLCVSSGETFSAAIFSSAISFSSSVFEFLTANVLLPLIVLYLALGIIGNLSEKYSLFAVNGYIKKFIKWSIGIFSGIFTVALSLQSFVSHSSDTLVQRSIRSAVGSFIPVIGSTLSGGIDSVFTLAANSKTSFAVLGIIIIFFIFIPPVIGNICYGVLLYFAGSIAAFLGVTKAEKTIATVADTFFIMAGVCSACVYMVIISFLIICININ